MALDAEREIRFVHAAPVVGDADEAPPARLDRDVDAPRAGVERVLDEFLDRRSRPLDHLARGDAVDEQRIEAANRHGGGTSGGLSHWSDGKWRRFGGGFTERVSVFAAFARASRASRGLCGPNLSRIDLSVATAWRLTS